MAARAVSIQQDQLDIIQMVSGLEDVDVVKKVKKYITKLTTPKPDPLYSPENVAACHQAYEEFKQGKSTRMTPELKEYYFGGL